MSHTNIRIEPVRLKIINKVGRPGSKVYFWRIGFSSAARRDRVSHHFCKNKPTSLFTLCRLDVLSRSDEMFYESKFYCLYLQLQSDIDMPKIHLYANSGEGFSSCTYMSSTFFKFGYCNSLSPHCHQHNKIQQWLWLPCSSRLYFY